MKIKQSDNLSNFLNFIDDVKSSYEYSCEQMKEQEALTQDLLHKLELDSLTYKERSKVATQLAINRKDRRYYKDVVEELEPIYTFFFDSENAKSNKKTLDMLRQVLGQVRKQENYHSIRTYIPKVLKEKNK